MEKNLNISLNEKKALIDYFSGNLSAEDSKILNNWLEKSEPNKLLFDQLSDVWQSVNLIKYHDKIDIEKILISGELKKDGLFYLHNSIKECKGIPLIFGRCNIRKARIGQTENNDLLFNVARDNSGTFLVVFSTGIRSNSAFIYEKIE